MRIAFITDLHIAPKGEDAYGVDSFANLQKVLADLPQWKPELMIIGGDICYRDSEAQLYQRVRTELDATGIPYYLISGNHDNSRELAQHFGIEDMLVGDELYYTRELAGRKAIFMDTSTYKVSQVQLDWLGKELQTYSEVLLFIHHPPCFAGHAFMDGQHPLQNIDELQDMLQTYPRHIPTFCGHYHIEKTVQHANQTVYITPSLFINIDQQSPDFEEDNRIPAWRLIELTDKGLQTTVRYLF